MFKWNPFTMFGEAPASARFISMGSQQSSAKQYPVAVSTQTPEQKAMMAMVGHEITPGLTGEVPAYPGQMYVSKTPEEEAYFASVAGGQTARQEAINKLLSGKPAYDINPAATEEYYQNAIRAPMMHEWEQTTLPGIKEAYAGPGYWGSARAGAQATAAENLATTLGSKRAELSYADEQARRAALESAAARMPAGEAAAATEEQLMGTAGQYSRMIDQEKVTADLQRWLMGETVNGVQPEQYNPFLQLAFSFLGLDTMQVGTIGKSSSSGWNVGIMSS